MIGQRESGRNALYEQFKLPQQVNSFLSPQMYVYSCVLFPPNEYFTYFTTIHLFVEIHFYKADESGLCHWPFGPHGPVLRIWCSHSNVLTSVSGNWDPASSSCRLRPPKIILATPHVSLCSTDTRCLHELHTSGTSRGRKMIVLVLTNTFWLKWICSL